MSPKQDTKYRLIELYMLTKKVENKIKITIAFLYMWKHLIYLPKLTSVCAIQSIDSAGFSGPDCIDDIDECLSGPCQYGSCLDAVDGYQCICYDGWEGTHCAEETDDCASSPCQFDGTCIDQHEGYHCQCQAGTSGERLEQKNNSNNCVILQVEDCSVRLTNQYISTCVCLL